MGSETQVMDLGWLNIIDIEGRKGVEIEVVWVSFRATKLHNYMS